MTRWQAIVFDLDDTLYAEREYVRSGMRAVAVWAHAELGCPAEATFAELWRLFQQGVRGDTFNRWLADRGLEANDRVAAMVSVYRRHTPQLTLEPETRKVLTDLGRRCRLGLVTDGTLEVQKRKVAALDLQRHFDAIVYSDALGPDAWKPSPRPFEVVLDRLSVPAGEAAYVADNPAKDFFGARQVGMATIRIRRPDGLHHDLQPVCVEHAPDVEIAALADLEALDEAPSSGSPNSRPT